MHCALENGYACSAAAAAALVQSLLHRALLNLQLLKTGANPGFAFDSLV